VAADHRLTIFHDRGDRDGIAGCLVGLAGLAAAGGDHQRAARVYATAEALRLAIKAAALPIDRTRHERRIATLRHNLGDEAFAAAWAAGRAMALEEAIAGALAIETSEATSEEAHHAQGSS
jgi:hypothetical protein